MIFEVIVKTCIAIGVPAVLCSYLADLVLPVIHPLNRWMDKLPLMQEDDDDE